MSATNQSPLVERIAAKIKERRADLELTYSDLAERTELSRAYLCELEQGKCEPGAATIVRLCRALQVTPNWLLSDSASSLPDPERPPAPTEKDRRVYYQSIVYDVCNSLGRIFVKSIVCGTVEFPSKQVQENMAVVEQAWNRRAQVEECAAYIEEQGRLLKSLFEDSRHDALIADLANGIRKRFVAAERLAGERLAQGDGK